MKICFLSEMPFFGKIESTHRNMRTEFAWMNALNADHFNINDYNSVTDYEFIFIIFPKGRAFLGPEGSRLSYEKNPITPLLESNMISILKRYNKFVFYIQEGPHWWWTNYEIPDQILFYNMVSECDGIFAHNASDVHYYRGLFPDVNMHILPSLMIDDLVKNIKPSKENKVMIGGNFSRWYGGFESYIIASMFSIPVWTQTSHAMRDRENEVDNLNHFPRLSWDDWMLELSKFKYAVHMMPTVAAGTFSLNCAYFGIPCIGNEKVDTQRLCFPELSIDISDIENAKYLANRLRSDIEFYNRCSESAIKNYKLYYDVDVFKSHMINTLNGYIL